MILIKDGLVVNPKTGLNEVTDIVIENEKVKQIGVVENEEGYSQIINANGCVVAPGFVDIHVHFREPGFTYKEDINTGAKSAAAGGFTSVICMANTKPVIDNEETLKEVLELAKEADIHVHTCASVTESFDGTSIVDMKHLKELGAIGFTDDGIPLMDEAILHKALQMAKELDVPISLHEEHPDFILSQGVNQGAVSEKLDLGGAPAISEAVMVWRDVAIALDVGGKLNIQHISSKSAVEAVRAGKKLGASIYAEVTPHHFSSTEDLVLEKGTNARMNPPLRTEEDRQAIIKGLQDDTIDFIATDHAPHTDEEKDVDFADAPSGIIGLETALALGITYLVKENHLTMSDFIKKLTSEPAKLYNLDAGTIEEGGCADLVIFDDSEKWVVPETFVSKSSNSPYIGEELTGKVKYTICKGKIVYNDN